MTSRRPMLTRRQIVAGVALSSLTPALRAAEGRVVLPPARALADEAKAAARAGHPLVVMVSLPGCPFCRMARDSYLGPLREERGVPVVQVDMRSGDAVRDFQGTWRTHDDLVRGWRVDVAPTLLFLGPGGRELAPRLGAVLPDFYGAYLDERLGVARQALRAR